jgi:hypothetical protein
VINQVGMAVFMVVVSCRLFAPSDCGMRARCDRRGETII